MNLRCEYKGTLNSTVTFPSIMQQFKEDTLNDNSDMLIECCSQNELWINNIFYHHKWQYKYTFSKRGIKDQS